MLSPAAPVHTRLMRSVREDNLASLLQVLRSHGPAARKQLCRVTGLSFTTVTRLVAALLEREVLVELDPRASGPRTRAGRPETPLDFRPDSRVVVGVHVHGHGTSCSVIDLSGQLVGEASDSHPDDDPDRSLAAAVELVRGVLAGIDPDRVLGIGVSAGAVVDQRRRVAEEVTMRDWRDVALGEPFDVLGHPVLVDSSVRALALQQLWERGGPYQGSGLTVLVSGLVSAALVCDGRLRPGTAGSMLHLPVPDGPGLRCSCGRTDCLGELVGSRGVHARAVAAGLVPADSHWNVVERPDQEQLSGIRQERAGWLGEVVAAAVELLDPDHVVVTGYLGGPEDAAHCLATAARRLQATLGQERSLVHRPLPLDRTESERVWNQASAALVVDDFLRHPLRYEPALL